jgi:uncharacterized protein (DUF433 family)
LKKSLTIRNSGVSVVDILGLIGQGKSFEQILALHRQLTLTDLLAAVQIAADIIERYVTTNQDITIDAQIQVIARSGRLVDLADMRQEYPRAYEPWDDKEEARLKELFMAEMPFKDIAARLQRNVGAVISRLKRLRLIK